MHLFIETLQYVPVYRDITVFIYTKRQYTMCLFVETLPYVSVYRDAILCGNTTVCICL